MKCLLIGPAFPLRGGIANFNEALCRSLNKNSVECSLVSFTLQYPSFLFPGKSQLESGKGPTDIRIYPMINSVNPLSWFRTARFIRSEKPDFIVIRYWLPFMAPCLGTIARLCRKKCRVIALTDNIIPHEKRPGDQFLTTYFVKSCDAFLAMSKAVLADISGFTRNSHKFFSPHPVYDIFGEKVDKSEARKHLGIPGQDRILLFFGFIRKYKGLDLLLEALADQRLKNERIKLIIAGEFYEGEEEYRKIAQRHQLEASIIYRTSFIPREEVKYYFSAADMVVQPYREATQSGITQIAYHFERPMLVTKVGGLPEIVADGLAGYVSEVDPTSIADCIVDFYTHHRENQFSKRAAIEKDKFSWDSFVAKLLEAYDSIR